MGDLITGRKLCGCYILDNHYNIVCRTHARDGIKKGQEYNV
jgi:hypothetical protein